MNDHNLDDLIIDNINPKNTKAKSLLTIIALAIVVLIIAIILTKIILKDPSESQAIDEETNTEMISPELTLQNAIKEEVKKEELALHTTDTKNPTSIEAPITPKIKAVTKKETITSNEVVEKIEKEVIEPADNKTAKADTVEIAPDIFDDEEETKAKEEAEKKRVLAVKLAEEKRVAKKAKEEKQKKERKMAEKVKQKKASEKKKAKAKIKITGEATSAQQQSNGRYYIQVGSFRQTPSKQFLSIIKKSGFNYRVTSPSSSGMKKLLIGPYPNRSSTDRALRSVRDRINKSAFVIKK